MGALDGLRVVVTRPRDPADDLVELLVVQGARVHEVPVFRVEPVPAPALADALHAGVDPATVIAFTSRRAVSHFVRFPGADVALRVAIIACVGPATAGAARKAGATGVIQPETFTAAALADTIARRRPQGGHVIFPCASGAGDDLVSPLRARGWSVSRFDIYTTRPERAATGFPGGVNVVTFASSSAVRMFAAIVAPETAAIVREGALAVCIGPATAQCAHEQGFLRIAVANPHTVAGLVSAIIQHVR